MRIFLVGLIIFVLASVPALAQNERECIGYENQFKIDFIDQTNIAGVYEFILGVQNGHNTEIVYDLNATVTIYDPIVNEDGEAVGFFWLLSGVETTEVVIKFGTSIAGTVFGEPVNFGHVASQDNKGISHFTICINELDPTATNETIPSATPTATAISTVTVTPVSEQTPLSSSTSTVVPTETIVPTNTATPTAVVTIIVATTTATLSPTSLDEADEPIINKIFLPDVRAR